MVLGNDLLFAATFTKEGAQNFISPGVRSLIKWVLLT
jgi:hypothetical protein